MSEEEYRKYLDYFISDYAAEISSNYRIPLEEANLRAQNEIGEDLPQGPHTAGQDLLCIDHPGNAGQDQLVGYLWVSPDRTSNSVFINDFYILAEHQGQGFGREALSELEERVSKEGFREIRLRVANSNMRARKLYEALGYEITGVNMSKRIENERSDP